MCAKDPSQKRSHFFKSFFLNIGHDTDEGKYDYSNVKRWSDNQVAGRDLFGLNKIVFLINMGEDYWVAACIFMEKKWIEMFDSLGGPGKEYLDASKQCIKDKHQAKKGSPLPDEDQWKLVGTQRDTPRQQNGYDCGVFTSMFADFLSRAAKFTCNQSNINQCRQWIALSILASDLIIKTEIACDVRNAPVSN